MRRHAAGDRGAQRQLPTSRIDQLNLGHGPRSAGEFVVVVENLDPISLFKSEDLIPAEARDSNVGRLPGDKLRDREDHRAVVPRPFEGRNAESASGVYFDAVKTVLQAAISAGSADQ